MQAMKEEVRDMEREEGNEGKDVGEARDMEREEGDEGKDVGEEDVEGRRVLRGGGMRGCGEGGG